jgi:hypothetical protein
VSTGRLKTGLVMGALAGAGIACALGSGSTAPTQAPGSPPPASQAPAPTAPPASTTGRDYSSLNVCQLLIGPQVESLTLGKLLSDPQASSVTDLAGCTYEIDPPGGDTYANYIVYVEPAALIQASLALGDSGDPVQGLGDQAFVQYDADNEEYRLQGTISGDGFEVIGDDKDATLAIGQALVALIEAQP